MSVVEEAWRGIADLYALTSVREAVIDLQDGFGVDVVLLLFALWHALKGRGLTRDSVVRLDEAVTGWRSDVIWPIRAARKAVRLANADLYERLKEAERLAEKLEIAILCDVEQSNVLECRQPTVIETLHACLAVDAARSEATDRLAACLDFNQMPRRAGS